MQIGILSNLHQFYINMLWYFQHCKSLLLKPLDQWKIGIVWFNKNIFERTWDVLAIHVGVLKCLYFSLWVISSGKIPNMTPTSCLLINHCTSVMHPISWRQYWCPQLFTWLTLVTSPTAWARIECDAVNQSSGTGCTLTPPPDTRRMKLNLALMRTSTLSSEGGVRWFLS